MTDRDRMIDDIILAFDWEMGIVERRTIMAEIFGGSSSNPMDAYKRQHRTGKEYDEQRAALRRVLRRLLPTDTTPPDTTRTSPEASENVVSVRMASSPPGMKSCSTRRLL